jgi:alpha-glucosidase
MKTITINQWKELFLAVADAIAAQEKRLNELDSLIGDGDHGSSIKRGFDAVKASISDSSFGSVGELFSRVGVVILQETGGAIGPLLGSFYMDAAKGTRGLMETDLQVWSGMFSSGVDRISHLGKAQPGDKTLLDALLPAAEVFKEAFGLGFPLVFAFRNAACAARRGADLTGSMVAKFGRAKFLGERALGHQDPGANSIFLMLDAMADALARMDRPGNIHVFEETETLSIATDLLQVNIHKEQVLLEISSLPAKHILKQALPFTFLSKNENPIPLARLLHWHLENDQVFLTCEMQEEHQKVFLLVDFPVPQSCRISLRGMPDGLRQCSVKFSSSQDENFFGGGERFSTVNQRGKRFECWAADRGPQQKPDHPWTYWPVPFFISNQGYSFLSNNFEKSVFDQCSTVQDEFEVLTESPNMSFEIFWADQPVEHIKQLFQRTGFPPLPPKWNNGVWVTCLGGEKAVLEKAHLLRQMHIPCSALWVYDAYDPKGNIGLPICPMHHSGDYQDVPGLVDKLHRMGFKVQTYLFPYFYTNTPPYKEAYAQGYFLKNPDGSTYQFPFWKAVGRDMVQVPASIVDFSNPQAKAWWQGLIGYILVDLGFDGWMHDFAEDIPEDVVAFNGINGAALHNLYPLLYQQAAREACLQVKPDASFYPRSGSIGSQAWLTAAWPGDQICTWGKNEGMSSALTACLSLSLCGVFFIGPDIGGYFGRGVMEEADSFSKELWIRWTQLGALSPIMRDHLGDKPDGSIELCTDQETLAIFKQFAWLHMSLSPYIQGCAAHSIKTGHPIMQHMFLIEPDNPVFWNCDDQYLFGDAMLVAPILQDGQRSRSIQLPDGNWISFWDGKMYQGGKEALLPAPLDQIPILVKEGAVLPSLLDFADTLVESSDGSVQIASENLKLQVYLPGNWENIVAPPVISHRELSDGTVIDLQWSAKTVHIQVAGPKNRLYLFVVPGSDKSALCNVNGEAIAITKAASDKRISCWHDDQSQTINVFCEGSNLDLIIHY